VQRAAEQVRTAVGTPMTVVGEVCTRKAGDPPVRVLDASGAPFRPRMTSWEHPV